MAGMVPWIISNLITIIKVFTESSPSSPSNLQQDLHTLDMRLRRIQAVIHDAEQQQITDASLRLWIQELQDLVYDAQDVMEDYHYLMLQAQVANRDAVAAIRKRKRYDDDDNDEQPPCLPHNMPEFSLPSDVEDRMKRINERFDEIARGREDYHLKPEDGTRRDDDLAVSFPHSSSFVGSDVVFGREEEKEEVIKLLFSDAGYGVGNVCVIPIVGMGGVGKTTLAQIVYNDSAVCQHFGVRAWVSVCDDFDVVRLTQKIIMLVSGKACDDEELDLLQHVLHREVIGRRFLIVLDDVWNERRNLWYTLRAPLCGAGRGKIIVTTRNEQVAKMMATVEPYRLGCLPLEKCWLLFRWHAFRGQDFDHPQQLIDVGMKIVKKCGGLPLAIKALGALLHYETDAERWMDVLQSEVWEQDKMGNGILPALRLSYNRMPSPLKPCFLYFSLFPKSFEILKEDLVRQWIAQGYITTSGVKSLQDVGTEYADELRRRSFFDCQLTTWGQDEFKMHDMVHDLARSISGMEFWTIRSNFDDQLINNPAIVRHLNFTGKASLISNFLSFSEVKALRTLLADDGSFVTCILQQPFMNVNNLRAVSLVDISMGKNPILELPDSIGKLKHLRYLNIHCPYLKSLPKSMSHLFSLQMLYLWGSDKIEELPADFGNLINLQYLYIHLPSIRRLPESFRHLCNLQTAILDCFNIQEFPPGFGYLKNLRRLDFPLTQISRSQETVIQLTNLQTIHLPYDVCCPRGISKLQSLKMLMKFYVGNQSSQCAQLAELKDLVNLGPELSINGLKNVVDLRDPIAANLQNKRHIEDLDLIWCDGVCTHGNKVIKDELSKTNLDEDVLENLQPHSNIKKLTIDRYGGAKFPKWMGDQSLCNLVNIKLFRCHNCISLPKLGQLPCLKELEVSWLTSLRIVGHEFCCGLYNNNMNAKVGFPSLVKLAFRYMPKWEEWHCNALNGEFPSLSQLSLVDCPMLRTIPIFPSLNKLFISRWNNLGPFPLHCNLSSNLIMLELINCESFVSLPLLGQLPCLKELKLYDLSIKTVGHEFCCGLFDANITTAAFNSLEQLEVLGMYEWEEWFCEGLNRHFPVLKTLVLTACPKLKALPVFPSLEVLNIDGLKNLTSLHLNHDGFSTIKHLSISNCSQLKSLVGIVNPIEELYAYGCPQLDLTQVTAYKKVIQ